MQSQIPLLQQLQQANQMILDGNQETNKINEQVQINNNQIQQEQAENQQQEYSIMNDPEEFEHFKNIAASFFNYTFDTMKDVDRMEQSFKMIGEDVKKLKYDYKERIKKMKEAINQNQEFLLRLVEDHESLFDFERDGKFERDQCFKPIIEEIQKYYPSTIKENGNQVRILLPGCGQGRLVFDFAALGYGAQGNEFAYHMLISSNFMLNFIDQPFQFTLYPYIHSFSNTWNSEDPFKQVKIPDVCPFDFIKPGADFSMVAGEFIEVYKNQKNAWDAIVTCFFIDTAHNIIQYIETIYDILQPGGVWINFGPLLYHYQEMEGEISIELSWEEVEYLIKNKGFQFKQQDIKQANYCSQPLNQKNMMTVVYNCIFFTVVKPLQ